MRVNTFLKTVNFVQIIDVVMDHSARNKDQKSIGRFLKIGYFYRVLTAVPLNLYGKFGQLKWILLGQMMKSVGKWPVADCNF